MIETEQKRGAGASHARRLLWEIVLVGLAPPALLLLFEGISRGGADKAIAWAIAAPQLAALNLCLWASPCALLAFARSNRVRCIGTLLLGMLCALLGVANRYKMFYRLEPLLFSDVTQLRDALQTVTALDFGIDMGEPVRIALVFAVGIALCAVFVHGRRRRHGVLLPLLGVAVLVLVPPLCTFERAGAITRYDMADHARANGTLYTAIASENQRRDLMRVDYREADVRAKYASLAAQTPAATAENPNIILVLNESFTTDRWLSQFVNLTRPLTPFTSSLMQSCESGRLYVPKVGGGTSETEFEVLTGLRSRYAINPYSMGLPPTSSLASVLRDRGYLTTALHWYSGVYYNRYHNLRMLGFDQFFTTDTTTTAFEKKGMFVSDAEHYRAVLDAMQRSPERDFVFCLTMQNHGGYEYDDFRQTYGADMPFTNALSPESEKSLINYCYLLEQSDRALEAFVAQLQAFEEPTVLVLFGDHAPPVGAAAYEALGIAAAGLEGHITPYLIWSNVQNTPAERDLYAYELGAHALRAAGVLDDPFLAYVESLRGENRPLTGTPPEDALYDLLSYDALFGRQYAYAEGRLSPASERFEIGGPMQLTGFDAAQIADAVYLRPRLMQKDQRFHLEVNGHRRDTRYIQQTDKPFDLSCVMVNPSGKFMNRSNTLHFANTAQLLEQAGTLGYTTENVWERPFERVERHFFRGYDVYRSCVPFPRAGSTALVLEGERWGWQPTYGIRKQGQYGQDGEGYLYLAVPRSVQSVPTYLYRGRATLYLLDD